jgi:predicted ATPase
MRFLSFTIENFKGIKDLTIDLSNAPSLSIYTLVGLNESGKTTILEAINMFRKPVKTLERHSLIPRSLSSNFSGNISVKAIIELSDEDKKLIKDYAKNNYKFNLERIGDRAEVTKVYKFKDSDYVKDVNTWSFDLVGKTTANSKSKKMSDWDVQKWTNLLDYIDNELMPQIIYYPDFLFDFPEKIYLSDKADVKNDIYKNMLQDVLDSLGTGSDLDKHVLSRMKVASTDTSKRRSLNATLLQMSTRMTETVIKPWDSIFSSKGSMGDSKEVKIEYGEDSSVTPSPTGEEIEKQYYLSIGIKQGSESYQIEERSLGFRWFFAFLMFTQFRKNRLSDKGETLFLVDEPASNLHSSMQERLASEISKIVVNCKLMFTTHSEYLINPDWLEATFVVKNNALTYGDEIDYMATQTDVKAITYRKFVSEHPNQQDYYQPVLSALDYEPSRLEMVDSITIVEGKNDYYTFKYINKVILNDRYKLFFYPGNGAKGNASVIRLYLAWGKKFNALFDGDVAGNTAKQFYIDEIGADVEDKILTLSDINKNWKGITPELLFNPTEQLRIINTLFPKQKAYSKIKFNQAMQSLLFHKTVVKLSAATIDKFNKIFSAIELSEDN